MTVPDVVLRSTIPYAERRSFIVAWGAPMRVLTRLGAIALIPIACALLGGCGILAGAKEALEDKDRTTPYPGLTSEAAATVEPRVKGLLQEMALAGMPVCSEVDAPKGSPQYACPPPGTEKAPGAPTEAGAPSRPTGADYNSAPNTALFLDRSMIVIDSNCAGYLSSLDRMGATSRFSRSQVNAVFNYLAVLMAMAGDDPEQLGYLNAAAGLFNTSADNLETLVLISPTPSKLTPLVEKAQAAARQQLNGIRQAADEERLSSAVRWVQQYAAMCTPRGIRQLLDEAIDTEADTGTSPPQVVDAAKRLGPNIAIVLAQMAPQDTDTSTWAKALQDQRVLGGVIWLIRDPAQVVGTDAKAQARQAYLEGLLDKPLYETLVAALADPKRGPILLAMVSGVNAPAYDEMVKVTQASEQQALGDTIVALAKTKQEAATKDAEEARRRIVELEAEIALLKPKPPAQPEQPEQPAQPGQAPAEFPGETPTSDETPAEGTSNGDNTI